MGQRIFLEYLEDNALPIKRFEKYNYETMTVTHKACLKKLYKKMCDAFRVEWRILKHFPIVVDGEVEVLVYQYFYIGKFTLTNGTKSP